MFMGWNNRKQGFTNPIRKAKGDMWEFHSERRDNSQSKAHPNTERRLPFHDSVTPNPKGLVILMHQLLNRPVNLECLTKKKLSLLGPRQWDISRMTAFY